MKLELIARFPDNSEKTKEQKHEEYIQSLLNNPDSMVEKVRYTYDAIVLDTVDVKRWIKVDSLHTQLNMDNNERFIIRLPYLQFCALWQEVTHENITQVEIVDNISTTGFTPIRIDPAIKTSYDNEE